MRTKSTLAILVCLALVAVATPSWAVSGALDTTFDGDGIFTFGLANPAEEGSSGVAVDPSGRLIVGNYVYPSNLAVSRVLAGGGLDPAFGSGGTSQLTDGKVRLTNAVGVQPDGKVLVTGNLGTGGENVFLVRYRANGNPDGTFANGGLAHVKMCGTTAYETNVFVRSDGSIVVVGDCGNGSTSDRMFVLAFRPGGNLDRSFSGDGILMLKVGDDFWARDATLDGNDRLTVVGNSSVGSKDDRATVVRLTAGGALDRTFSGDGIVTLNFASGNDIARAVTTRGSGVLVAEQAVGAASSDILLFALTAKGKLSGTFSGDGKARISFVTNNNPVDMTTDAKGRIYIAANYQYGTPTEASVIRAKPNGAVDTSFAGGGITHTGIDSSTSWVTMWKGKPTIVGYANLTTDFDDMVARFLP
jgi:uncharacterized delta-60 repeat protein